MLNVMSHCVLCEAVKSVERYVALCDLEDREYEQECVRTVELGPSACLREE